MRPFISLFASYLLACPLTSLVSVDLRETQWANVLTYFWIIGSVPLWAILIGVVGFVASVFARGLDV